MRWRKNNDQFRADYEQARQDQADTYAELALEVALSATNAADAQRARLAFDAYRWAAGKLKPGTYGDKVQHTGTGPDGAIVSEVTYRWQRPDEDKS